MPATPTHPRRTPSVTSQVLCAPPRAPCRRRRQRPPQIGAARQCRDQGPRTTRKARNGDLESSLFTDGTVRSGGAGGSRFGAR